MFIVAVEAADCRRFNLLKNTFSFRQDQRFRSTVFKTAKYLHMSGFVRKKAKIGVEYSLFSARCSDTFAFFSTSRDGCTCIDLHNQENEVLIAVDVCCYVFFALRYVKRICVSTIDLCCYVFYVNFPNYSTYLHQVCSKMAITNGIDWLTLYYFQKLHQIIISCAIVQFIHKPIRICHQAL